MWLDWLAFSSSWQAATPEIIILFFALMAPMVAIRSRRGPDGMAPADRAAIHRFAVAGIAGAWLITLGSLTNFSRGIISTEYIGETIGDAYAITYASQSLKLLLLSVALIAVIGIGRPLKGRVEEDWGEFLALILFATLGMMVVVSAQELFTMFLGIEMASLSSYLLAGFQRDKEGAEASMKYFVIGAISSGATLFAISLLYGMAGTTTLAGIREAVTMEAFGPMSIVAIVLLLVGLGFKISSIPFHAWAPDVYCGGPVALAGLLASASKAMGFAALFSVFLVGLVGVKDNWQLAVAVVAIATMFFGNLVAIQQQSVRRMLAYSSIAQAGYVLIALAVGTVYAVGGGIFHLWMNAAMKLGAFTVVGALLWAGLSDRIDSMRGLGKRSPFLAFAMLVFLLSMAGIPPLGGFWSKFVLFSSAVDLAVIKGESWLWWLAAAAVINSAISLYYYLRVIRAMYVEKGDDAPLRVSNGTLFAVGACLLLVISVGLSPDLFIHMGQQAAATMLPSAG